MQLTRRIKTFYDNTGAAAVRRGALIVERLFSDRKKLILANTDNVIGDNNDANGKR